MAFQNPAFEEYIIQILFQGGERVFALLEWGEAGQFPTLMYGYTIVLVSVFFSAYFYD
jgi:hypothetical protein